MTTAVRLRTVFVIYLTNYIHCTRASGDVKQPVVNSEEYHESWRNSAMPTEIREAKGCITAERRAVRTGVRAGPACGIMTDRMRPLAWYRT